MQRLVDTYQCEWAAVVRDPEKRRRFRQFVNTDETEPCIEIVAERGPAPPGVGQRTCLAVAVPMLASASRQILDETAADDVRWVAVGHVSRLPAGRRSAVKYGRVQIAVFNFASRGEWYASQNMCPHKKAFVLSRRHCRRRRRRRPKSLARCTRRRSPWRRANRCRARSTASAHSPCKVEGDDV